MNSDRSDIENWKPGSSANIALQLLMPSLSKVERDKAIKSALNQNDVGQIENSGQPYFRRFSTQMRLVYILHLVAFHWYSPELHRRFVNSGEVSKGFFETR